MGLEFDRPATYQIRVKGYLDNSWSDRLGGMEIRAIDQAEGAPETILVGWLPDQAALSGVLNALYNLHLSLRSVELIRLEEVPESDQAAYPKKDESDACERELARLEVEWSNR